MSRPRPGMSDRVEHAQEIAAYVAWMLGTLVDRGLAGREVFCGRT